MGTSDIDEDFEFFSAVSFDNPTQTVCWVDH